MIARPVSGPRSLGTLMVGAIGVVYGDIGTSPLYALKQCFAGPHELAVDPTHIFGVISLIFWSVMIMVSFKYVAIVMRADNKGEGGSLALLALVTRLTQGSAGMSLAVVVLGIFAAALFYGDSMITPAISVMSAVEGLELAAPALHPLVVPVTVAILIFLFLIQRRGTALVGALFGPIMCVWFAVLAALGVWHIASRPEILLALDPRHAVGFFVTDGWVAFLALGSVVLAVTGAEALYADMGHFGRRPIRISWFALILPALMLNYMGQGALLLNDPTAIKNPFFNLVPDWGLMPMVVLATMATVIASQAVISGAFSVTRQAIQLGYLPRMAIVHTSSTEQGQIYIPFINWMLMVMVTALVIGFGSSENLAAAYGVAVTGTMLIDTLLVAIVIFVMWRWNRVLAATLVLAMFVVDFAFFAANATKIAHGGWFPLAIGLVIFVLLTTWKRGRGLLAASLRKDAMPIDLFLRTSSSSRIHKVPGTAVFMTGTTEVVPPALLHNLKHNKVLHERNALLTVIIEDVPFVAETRRLEIVPLADGFVRVILRFGFMDEPNVPGALLREGPAKGFQIDIMTTSFFLGRETIVPSEKPGMARWREIIFAWMSRNATSAMDFFGIPTNRVIELGTQVEI
jgi:KUP system potassium uptake protein